MTLQTAILFLPLFLYLAASLLFQGHFLLGKNGWNFWGRKTLQLGMGIHVLALLLHFLVSSSSPFSNMLFVISLPILALLVVNQLVENYTSFRHLSLLAAPLAFFGLLYPVLMPLRFAEAESLLLHYPWLGIHVIVTLLGNVGFALASCAAVSYLIQARSLKQGRLNRYLPALDTATSATDHFVGAGFFLFTLGLGMGVVWLFGAPGEYLGARDTKIWMALPTWLSYASYLFLRGVSGRHGSRLKWLVIAGFLLALANQLAVRHDFEVTPEASVSPGHQLVWSKSSSPPSTLAL